MKHLLIVSFLFIVFFGCSKKSDNPVETVPTTPVVKIISPENNTTVIDSVFIQVSATDDKGIIKVDIYIDNQIPQGGSLKYQPYIYAWNTIYLADSSEHEIYVKAYDTDGNVTTTPIIKVLAYKFMPPSNLSIVSYSTNEAILHWKDNTKLEKGFIIERQIGTGSFVELQRVDANNTYYSDNNLDSTTTYGYRVKAFADSKVSPASEIIHVGYSYAQPTTLTGHTSSVFSVDISPDGSLIASGGQDDMIKIWRFSDGTLLKSYIGGSYSVTKVMFNPQGTILVSTNGDKSVKLWETTNWTLIRNLSGHTDATTDAVFNNDGSVLASGSWDATVKLWQVSNGALIKTLSADSPYVLTVAFSPDGNLLATGGNDYKVKLWQKSNWSNVLTFTGHTGNVNDIVFSPTGNIIASTSNDHTIKLWQVSDGSVIKTIDLYSPCVAFSPDGLTLAAGNSNNIELWDISLGVKIGTLIGHTFSVHPLKFSSDGKFLVSGAMDNKIKIWKLSREWQKIP